MNRIVTKPSGNRLLILWLALFVVCLVVYVYVQPPAKYIFYNLTPILTAFVLTVSIIGFGSIPVLSLAKEKNVLIQILTSFSMGIGLTGAFVLVLGFAGLIRTEIFIGWIAAGILLFVYALRRWSSKFSFSVELNNRNGLFLTALVLFLINGLPFFVSPEVSRDATEYHLLIPSMWLRMGEIKFIPLLVESNYPPLAELVYLMILPVAGEIACKCFHFFLAIALLLLIAQFSKKLNPDTPSSLAPLMFITMPIVYVLAGWAWNDLFFSFFILLSIYFLIEFNSEALENKKITNVVIAGVSLGLAACTKYTFILYIPGFLILFLIGTIFWRWSWKNILFFFLPVGILSLSWIIKNWMFTGNPVFPFLNEIFQSPHWTENADRYFRATLNRYEIGTWSWWTYLSFPFLLTVHPRIIDVHTGIMPLMMSILLFRKNRSETEKIMKWFVLLSILSWLIFQTIIRSLLPVLAIILCLGSVALQEIRWQSSLLRRLCVFLIAVSISLNLFIATITTQHLFDPFRYFIGMESKAQYLSRMSTAQPVYDELNKRSDVKQVLLISLHNPLYLKKRALFSSCCDPPIAEVLTSGTSSSSDVAQKMRRLGISHVVVRRSSYTEENEKRLYSWSKQDRNRFEQFLKLHCDEVRPFGDFILFRIK